MNDEDKLAMGWIANALLSSVLVGNQCDAVKARYERMKNLQPGDLVFEASTWGRLARDVDLTSDLWDGQFVRYLRTEVETDGDWSETVYVCANPDGTEFRWTNASLWAMPEGPRWSAP